jgi:hypothetical protein
MLPSSSGRSINRSRSASLILIVLMSTLVLTAATFAQGKSGNKAKPARRSATASPAAAQSLTNIPLPVGHDAKGLVLPDFDSNGHLRGKFAAKTARRLDEGHVGFEDLQITTYTAENQPDLHIDMHTGVLDLKTRILSSKERTTVKRTDFDIVGDSVQFDTDQRTGRLVGNVKMVLNQQSQLIRRAGE